MPYSSREKDFYQRGGRNQFDSCLSELDWELVRERSFDKGKRYSLVESILSNRSAHGRLLELGCGHGDNLRYIMKNYGFKEGIGIDVIFEDKICIQSNPLIVLQPGNLNESIPLEDKSVTMLVAMMVFEHLFDPFHSFGEVHRLLSADGVAIINLPLVTSIRNRLRLLFGALPETSVGYGRWLSDRSWDGNHLHYFSLQSIKDICSHSGLKIIAHSGCGNLLRLKNLRPSLFAGELTFAVEKL